MSVPLYDQHQAPDYKPDDAHGGLWFERFFNAYAKNGEIEKTTKKKWLKSIVDNTTGNAEQLAQFSQRQAKLVAQQQGKSECYSSDWNFVTGMGNPHPVENGFSWHPTLAVPYLNGAAVKGLTRAWVESEDGNLAGESDEQKQLRLKHWFGTVSKDSVPEQTGGFIFFDALPDEPVELVCDIMTPHMGKWYSDGATASPAKPDTLSADWHEPVPISFLVVKKTHLIFHIAPRNKKEKAELDVVFNALTDALEWLGAGAKTGTGYGYFTKGSESDINQLPCEQEWLNNCCDGEERRKFIFTKGLAEKWQEIENPEKKQKIKELIRQEWCDWWDEPNGRSMKAAHKIYRENE